VNGAGFLLIVVAFAFLWFVVMRPQKRRRVEQQRLLESIRVGDEVLTAGGIYGRVTGLKEDEVTLEIAPELEVRLARRAVAGVLRDENEPEYAPEPAEAPDSEEHG
jgi:preprotein translocase subunit YajC